MVKFIIRLLVILVAVVAVQTTNAAPKKNKKEKKDNVVKVEPSAPKPVIESDDIVRVTTATGTDKEDAVKNALRDALAQTYGVFVSSHTEVLNDDIIKDEIITLESGNVKHYEILNEQTIGDKIEVTVSSIVSIGKLISFAKSHGAEAELAGEAFAMKLKLEDARKEAYDKAAEHLRKLVQSLYYKDWYNYSITISEPYSSYSHLYGGEVSSVDVLVKFTPTENQLKVQELVDNYINQLPKENCTQHDLDYYKNTALQYFEANSMPAPDDATLSEIALELAQKESICISDAQQDLSDKFNTESIYPNDLSPLCGFELTDGLYRYKLVPRLEWRGAYDELVSDNPLVGYKEEQKKLYDNVGNSNEYLYTQGENHVKITLYYTRDDIAKITKISVRPIENLSFDKVKDATFNVLSAAAEYLYENFGESLMQLTNYNYSTSKYQLDFSPYNKAINEALRQKCNIDTDTYPFVSKLHEDLLANLYISIMGSVYRDKVPWTWQGTFNRLKKFDGWITRCLYTRDKEGITVFQQLNEESERMIKSYNNNTRWDKFTLSK